MDEEPDWAADDPDIAALLTFTPVPRGVVRGDGWDPARQRGFIAWLAATGNVIAAARAVRRSESGAKQLRREDETGEFAAAWSKAVALHRSRNGVPDRGAPPAPPRHARELRDARARRREEEEEAELDEAEQAQLIGEILQRYSVKLQAERRARLEGRITEADFYVRQLTVIELILDIGGRTQALLEGFRKAGLPLPEAAATPGSTLLEKVRRAFWQEKGEADRPPPAPLGWHNDRYATGRPQYDPARDGDRGDWEREQEATRRLAAEAQAEWEARARREAEARGCNDNDPDPQP